MASKKTQTVESLTELEIREEAEKRAKEKAEEARKKQAANIRRAYKQVANTEAGRIVFRHLMGQCGFHSPSVNVNPQTGEIFTDNTVYNEARRNLWLTTRKLIPPPVLVKIEFNLEAANYDDDDDDWI